VEAGTKGFWFDYPNINKLIEELGIENPFTEFLTSGFWSPEGLITEAPVFSNKPQAPTILGQFLYTSSLFYRLSLSDRLTIIPWLYHILNFDTDSETYKRYDEMTAKELFRNSGVTKNAYELFLKPTLLVGLFNPPEDLSAAVVLETLYFYALAHQNSFDVRWCRGSISEYIFKPLVDRIEKAGGAIRGGRFVTGLILEDDDQSAGTEKGGGVCGVVATNKETGLEEIYEADADVFALSISGMQKLISSAPVLARRQEFRNIMNLRSIDCIATRIWFDRRIPTRFPANVLAGFEEDVGCTYFNLTDLQDEFKDEPGTVISADFYGATTLMQLTDEEIVKKVCDNMATCESAFRGARVVDSAVLRFPRAVTHFSPGSLKYRPEQLTSFGNVVLAGDWVKGVPHGANGLSQERSWVTGLFAANQVVQRLGRGREAEVLPVEPDEPHTVAAKTLNRQVKQTLETLGVRLPFL